MDNGQWVNTGFVAERENSRGNEDPEARKRRLTSIRIGVRIVA